MMLFTVSNSLNSSTHLHNKTLQYINLIVSRFKLLNLNYVNKEFHYLFGVSTFFLCRETEVMKAFALNCIWFRIQSMGIYEILEIM